MTKWVGKCSCFFFSRNIKLLFSKFIKHGFSLNHFRIIILLPLLIFIILFCLSDESIFHLQLFRDKLFTRKDYGQFGLGFSGLTSATSWI